MSLAADPYAIHVTAAYAASAVVIGVLIWMSFIASRRARRELEGLEREHRR